MRNRIQDSMLRGTRTDKRQRKLCTRLARKMGWRRCGMRTDKNGMKLRTKMGIQTVALQGGTRMGRSILTVSTKMGLKTVYSRSGTNKETSSGRPPIRRAKKCCNGWLIFLWYIVGNCQGHWFVGVVQRKESTLKRSYCTNWLIGPTGTEYGH